MQALAALRDFCRALQANTASFPQQNDNALNAVSVDILRQMADSSVLRGPLDPTRLRERIAQASPKFGGAGQQDAHEFFLDLLGHLHDGLVAARASWLSGRAPPANLEEGETALATHTYFHSKVLKRLTCTGCCVHRDVCELFTDFSLDLEGGAVVELAGMLRNYFAGEQMTATCQACSAETAFMSKFLMAPPKVLVLHLKRFVFHPLLQRYEKRHQSVTVPRELDLSACGIKRWDGSTGSPGRSEPMPYELRAVIAHDGGSPYAGHYVTYAQDAGGIWRLYDDTVVQEVVGDLEEQLARRAYLLFYTARSGRA